MATRTAPELLTFVSSYISEIVSSRQRLTLLPSLLPKRYGRPGGIVRFDAKFGTATGSTIDEGAAVSTFNKDEVIPALLNYGNYIDAFEVTGRALATAAVTDMPRSMDQAAAMAAMGALLSEELGDCIERILKKVSIDCYTGTGATNIIHGLLATNGPLDTTGTYAGIARSSYAQWASNELDANDGAYNGLGFLPAMRALQSAIFTASEGRRPDVWVCGSAIHDLIGAELEATAVISKEIFLSTGPIKLPGGYMELSFDGVPILKDLDCPADTIVALNTRHLYLESLKDFADPRINGKIAIVPMTSVEGQSTGLEAAVLPLARAGDKTQLALYAYPQLVCNRPNSCGSIINASDAKIV